MKHLNNIKKQLKDYPIKEIPGGFEISYIGKEPVDLSFQIEINKLIFPVREGEFIDDVLRLPLGKKYSITYPGTASTKSMALFVSKNEGIFIGGAPTYQYARITIVRIRNKRIKITYHSSEHHLFFYCSNINWRKAADIFKKKVLSTHQTKPIKQKPKYFLQIGVIDPFGNCGIKHFKELIPIVKYFKQEVGTGHIIHLFGTNEAGFDRMFPDYTIAKRLGGKKALEKAIKKIKKMGFMTSHHYNPRIADSLWLKKNPSYLTSIFMRKNGELVSEQYKGHTHYVMNPNSKMWFNRCMKTVKYLDSIGFDYIQLDQFTYQRNFYSPDKPIQLGYRQLIDEFEKLGIKYWLEGVSDVHKLHRRGDFYQILTRDRSQIWDEDNENRRGYPYGRSYPYFFMYLFPDSQISYQVITENNHTSSFEHRLKVADKINAQYYDLQMSFFDEKYLKTLNKVIHKIEKYIMKHKNKIGIIHYRIGKTDGVSLEIMKKKRALEKMGYQVKLISGPKQSGANYIIPELEFDRKDILRIKENAFFKLEEYPDDERLLDDIYHAADVIENKFLKINQKENFDILMLHNIFTHGRHIAAAKAFFDVSNKVKAQVIGFNHDFYETYGIYNPQTPKIRKFLKQYVPPHNRAIKHVVINSISQKLLRKKINKNAIIFPDMFEFNQKPWKTDAFNSSFLNDFRIGPNDLVVLQATRIVERKGIELAIDLVHQLNRRRDELEGKTLYNGKTFTKDSKIIMVFAGYVEPASREYAKKLKSKIKSLGISARFISSRVNHERHNTKGAKKIYSLWDTYVFADLVTFPSLHEGWGNQFIEAVFAKKPVAVFEYPVFKADIKKEGYEVITFGDKVTIYDGLVRISKKQINKTADQAIKVLNDPKTKEVLNENFLIGRNFHGEKALAQLVRKMILS